MLAAAVVAGSLAVGEFSSARAESIVNSKHNLSVSGPGSVKAAGESEICVFCHTPHNALGAAPLWNRYESGQTYVPYTSTTVKASVGQPTGASKLCLSCHDGTVALGMVSNRSAVIPFVGGVVTMPAGESRLGIDLSDDHPVSFVYDAGLAAQNAELKDPSSLTGAGEVRLDNSGLLQCTACHDPHNNQYGRFLNVNAVNSGLCTQCHAKNGWTASPHNTSAKAWNGTLPDPWPDTEWTTVAQNGCQNCHLPHNAGGHERLLRYAAEESNCAACHNANVAGKNIGSEFSKLSVHPVSLTTGAHTPSEAALIVASRHVECADCHDPHAANDQDTPALPGSLRQRKGINASGAAVTAVNYEYELCFRCHADSSGTTVYVNRQYPQKNTRLEFDTTNASYHPVESVGKNPNVPSLIVPYTTASIIKCTSCHNNDQGTGNNGTGPNGPHGSAYAPLLEKQLVMADNQTESAAVYALCYKCHDRNSILGNQSFSLHRKHIIEVKAACTVCHDPHGVRDTPRLINFDRNVVSPNPYGILRYESLGTFYSRCNLRCHGRNHINYQN